jgi:RNA polymerase sigma factor (sigma-70 family)
MQSIDISYEFINLIKDNERLIFKICRIYTNQSEDFKDLYQEIVCQIWKSYNSFKNECRPTTWMYKIALNTALTYNKKNNKHFSIFGTNIKLPEISDNSTFENDEDISLLYKAIEQLNNLDKAIILMYLENKNHEEIASVTGITQTNVSTRLMRIKEKLRKYMNINM